MGYIQGGSHRCPHMDRHTQITGAAYNIVSRTSNWAAPAPGPALSGGGPGPGPEAEAEVAGAERVA